MIVVLKENKAILGVMGLLTSGDDIRTILPILLWSIPLISLLMPCIAYSLSNINDVNKATEATYVVAADVLCLGQYWFLVAQRNELKKILKRLDGLVQKRSSSSSFKFYTETESKIVLFTKGMKVFVITSSSICLFLPFFVAAITYLRGTYSARVWFLPYKVVMPFDEGTALGYGLTMINQLVGSWVICLIICNVNSFFFGICSYIETMLTDLFCMFDVIEEHLKKYVEYPSHYFIDVQLRNIIRCHIDIMSFTEEFGKLMNGVVFITFCSSVMWICTSLFQIQSNLQHIDYLLLQSIVTTSAIILIIMIFCYFGNIVTSKYSDLATVAYASNWYRFSPKLRRYIVRIIAQSQNEIYFRGFKVAHCSLMSFTNLINRSWQIFMLFRSIE